MSKLKSTAKKATPECAYPTPTVCNNLIRSRRTNQHLTRTNQKEHQRQVTMNKAFLTLRLVLPTNPPNKKLSKIEVLRRAITYIDTLQSILHDYDLQDGLHDQSLLQHSSPSPQYNLPQVHSSLLPFPPQQSVGQSSLSWDNQQLPSRLPRLDFLPSQQPVCLQLHNAVSDRDSLSVTVDNSLQQQLSRNLQVMHISHLEMGTVQTASNVQALRQSLDAVHFADEAD